MALRTISVGIDGSSTAHDAFGWAIGLAKESESKVHVVHAWQTRLCSTMAPAMIDIVPSEEVLIEHSNKILHDAVERLDGFEELEAVVLKGAAGPALVAESEHADLTVIGRTGTSQKQRRERFVEILLGSTARYCLHHAHGPIAAVPDTAEWTSAPTVVVGIDGSAQSLEALTWAVDNLPIDATVHAVRAITLDYLGEETPFAYELLDDYVDRDRRDLRALVDETVGAEVESQGREVHCHTILGAARDALIDPGFAVQMIVVGEHGQSGVATKVLGSVSDHTLRYAPCPVIVVPSADRAAAAG